jgi:hypothetical protein
MSGFLNISEEELARPDDVVDLALGSGPELAGFFRNSGTDLIVLMAPAPSETDFVLDITDFPAVT